MSDNAPTPADHNRAVVTARQSMYAFIPIKTTRSEAFRTAVAAYTDAVDIRAYTRGAKDAVFAAERLAEAQRQTRIIDRTPQLLKVPKGTRMIVWSGQVPSFFDRDGGRL